MTEHDVDNQSNSKQEREEDTNDEKSEKLLLRWGCCV